MVDDTGREELHKAKQDYEQRLADALSRQKNPKPAPKTSYGMDLNSVYSPEAVSYTHLTLPTTPYV